MGLSEHHLVRGPLAFILESSEEFLAVSRGAAHPNYSYFQLLAIGFKIRTQLGVECRFSRGQTWGSVCIQNSSGSIWPCTMGFLPAMSHSLSVPQKQGFALWKGRGCGQNLFWSPPPHTLRAAIVGL